MKKDFIVGVFDDEEKLVMAGQQVRKANFKIVDFYTPFPVHGLDELLEIQRTRLPFVTFGAGAFGLSLALGFQVWTSAVDWPLNVGGKPMLSIPAFIPITFELMVLFGALVTVVAFILASKLSADKKIEIINPRQLDDKFLVVVEALSDSENVKKILKDSGACSVEEKKLEIV